MAKPLTAAQERILYWLWAHPTVTIGIYDDSRRVYRGNWSHWWRNGAAFENMRKCAALLNGGMIEAPRRAPVEGGTPTLRTASFERLRDEGLIGIVRVRPKGRIMSRAEFYSITPKGRSAIGVGEALRNDL